MRKNARHACPDAPEAIRIVPYSRDYVLCAPNNDVRELYNERRAREIASSHTKMALLWMSIDLQQPAV